MEAIPEEGTAPQVAQTEKQAEAIADVQYHSGEEEVHSDEMDAGFSSGEEAGVQPQQQAVPVMNAASSAKRLAAIPDKKSSLKKPTLPRARKAVAKEAEEVKIPMAH